jgi:O-methyltransferase involved in polyketide biosynthesis
MADSSANRESGTPDPAPTLASDLGLQGVSRTLLIPLYARAHAATLMPRLGYDDPFARALAETLRLTVADVGRDRFTMRLCIARSAALQEALSALLAPERSAAHGPKRMVVVLACGLDTLPQRLGSGLADWICADLPEVMALRDRLLPPVPGVIHVPAVLPDHLDDVAARLATGRPVFVLEGVLPYLSPDQVVQALSALSALAPRGADVLVDGYHPALLAFARLGDGFRRMRVRFRFGLADTRDYARLAPRLRHRRVWDLLARIPLGNRKRCILPAVVAAGRPLATVVQLEVLPT